MSSNSHYLSAAIEQLASNMDKFSALIAFNASISDKRLKKLLNVYPSLCIIAERALQIGNIRRAEKYYALLKRIEKETNDRYAACIDDLERKMIGE